MLSFFELSTEVSICISIIPSLIASLIIEIFITKNYLLDDMTIGEILAIINENKVNELDKIKKAIFKGVNKNRIILKKKNQYRIDELILLIEGFRSCSIKYRKKNINYYLNLYNNSKKSNYIFDEFEISIDELFVILLYNVFYEEDIESILLEINNNSIYNTCKNTLSFSYIKNTLQIELANSTNSKIIDILDTLHEIMDFDNTIEEIGYIGFKLKREILSLKKNHYKSHLITISYIIFFNIYDTKKNPNNHYFTKEVNANELKNIDHLLNELEKVKVEWWFQEIIQLGKGEILENQRIEKLLIFIRKSNKYLNDWIVYISLCNALDNPKEFARIYKKFNSYFLHENDIINQSYVTYRFIYLFFTGSFDDYQKEKLKKLANNKNLIEDINLPARTLYIISLIQKDDLIIDWLIRKKYIDKNFHNEISKYSIEKISVSFDQIRINPSTLIENIVFPSKINSNLFRKFTNKNT